MVPPCRCRQSYIKAAQVKLFRVRFGLNEPFRAFSVGSGTLFLQVKGEIGAVGDS